MAANYDITLKLHAQLEGLGPQLGNLQRQIQGAGGAINLNTTAAQAGVSRLTSGLQASQLALRQVQSAAAATNPALQATANVTGSLSFQLANFATQAGLAARRAIAFSLAAGGIYKLVQGIREGVSAAVAFDLSMNKVSQVSSETSDKVAEVRGEISKLATGLGVSSAELAETAVTLRQAGLNIEQTRDALKAIALTDLAPSFGSMKQSTEGLIAAFRQFNIDSKDFESTLGSINAVAAAYAVESSDLITTIQKTGGAFRQTGGDLNELLALFTSVRGTTRESAEEISTGLRTIFTRVQRADTVAALKDLQLTFAIRGRRRRRPGTWGWRTSL
jgi:hypothetical protein